MAEQELPRHERIRRACDVRRAIMRRAAESPNEHGEGQIAGKMADDFLAALAAGDKPALELIRQGIAEICGPPKQEHELSGGVQIEFTIRTGVGE
jgi:hypothetical protein